ncbi:hypothetical protein GALMADRAFT_147426 [Galerina marginata CBS 339.88]|uniref:F-box domain-containing protein n=1 Tax=Galerina marginata (strain CBS 339.88) TaxID=685588 RepID=A0A067SH01_GALM3|nr:hypothetical protein GALMADRAFT_147426 [Galerina marginata CBS 339.88]
MPPPGAHLSLDELIAALKWKLEDEDDGTNSIEMGGPSDLRWASWASTWSQRLGELKHISNLVAYRQNTVAGVNLLPAEILSKIFLQLQAEYSNKSFCLPPEEQDLTGANEWIKVTHVCRIWRRCAQNTKVLWSRIILGPDLPSPASMATHFFHLSHPLPISLEQAIYQISNAENAQMHKFHDLLHEYPNRVSALYLRGYFPETAWHLFQKSLPNLVELELAFESRQCITDFLRGSPMSTLRKLSINDYAGPGLTPPPPVLTHLYLTDYFRIRRADFFSMLRSISSTLQALYLKGAGPKVLSSEAYDPLSITERLVMPALEHFEIVSSTSRDSASSLLYLYKLSLPNVHTIIWDSRWTKDLQTSTPAPMRTSMIPPNEHLACMTRLIGWAARENCYALQGETLYFDPSKVTAPLLEMWVKLLPNLAVLAVPGCVRWDNMGHAIQHSTTLRHLHIGETSKFIGLASILEEASHTDCLPHFEVLTIYSCWAVDWCWREAKERFARMRLEPLSEPLINNSVTRARDHLQTTYILRFDVADSNGCFLTDLSI